MELKKDLLCPLFLAGLAIKVMLAFVLNPAPQADWFIPFFENFWRDPGFAPWDYVLQSRAAFPYGIVMFVLLLPLTYAGFALQQVLSFPLTGVGLALTLVLADTCLYLLLCNLLDGKRRQVLLAYWFSPISLAGLYWVGQLDVIPVSLLFAALLALRKRDNVLSGLLLAASCNAKLSMAAVLPFFFIYLYTPRLRSSSKPFAYGLAAGFLALFVPPLFSEGYRLMVLGTPEAQRLFHLHIPMGDLSLFLTPIMYGFGLYFAWRVRRLTFDLFCTIIGLSFFLLVFSTPAPPGWYLWLVPFITIFQVNATIRRHWLLLFVFSSCVTLVQILFWPGPSIPLLGVSLRTVFPEMTQGMPAGLHSVWISALFFLGMVVYISMLRENVYRNKAYITWRRPIGIAITGDSGTGKDRLARMLAGMFGKESIAHISGDDYHLWDRFGVMWRSFTHLHPGANNLRQFSADVMDMFNNKSIACREYNHATGRFNPPKVRHGNDIIIVSGLHALMNKALRDKFDIRVYLDMDEQLRCWFKCRRDCLERGHDVSNVMASIERRRDDGQRFIAPQCSFADIIFSLYSVSPLHMDKFNIVPKQLGLRAVLRGARFSDILVRQFIGVCGMRVDVRFTEDLDSITLVIEGELPPEDTAFLASHLFPQLMELLSLEPLWAGGMDGVMQLIILSYLADKMERKELHECTRLLDS